MAQTNTQLLQLTVSAGQKCRLARLLCSGPPEAAMQVLAGRGSQLTRGGSASQALELAAACPQASSGDRSCGFESLARERLVPSLKGLAGMAHEPPRGRGCSASCASVHLCVSNTLCEEHPPPHPRKHLMYQTLAWGCGQPTAVPDPVYQLWSSSELYN